MINKIEYYEGGSWNLLLLGNWWAIFEGELLDKWFLTVSGLTIDILFIDIYIDVAFMD